VAEMNDYDALGAPHLVGKGDNQLSLPEKGTQDLRCLAVQIEDERYKLGEFYTTEPSSLQTVRHIEGLEQLILEYMNLANNGK